MPEVECRFTWDNGNPGQWVLEEGPPQCAAHAPTQPPNGGPETVEITITVNPGGEGEGGGS